VTCKTDIWHWHADLMLERQGKYITRSFGYGSSQLTK